MQVSYISASQFKKIFKTVGYLAISAAISGLISMIADDPKLFGTLTPVVNILLVTLKQVFTQPEGGR